MIFNQLQPLADHLWQSTLFAAGAAILTLALKGNRAQTRYRLWLAASVKFLIPFTILVNLGQRFRWHSPAAVAQSGLTYVMQQVGQPFTVSTPEAAIPATRASNESVMLAILGAVWAVGFVIVVFCWWGRWRRLRATVRTASPLELPINVAVRTSPAFVEPGVFGILRPVLLLPADMTNHLTPSQLEAILTHELCHIRRRDNLATAIHMAVEAVFWFHPMIWWLGARLMDERENACDEEVLLKGSTPEVYAEGILKVCELYLESRMRFVAGVRGGNLKKRIETIMTPPIWHKVTFGRKLLLTAAGLLAVTSPLLVGMMNAPPSPPQAGAHDAFEVASIKRNTSASPVVELKPPFGGRFRAVNVTLRMLVMRAYRMKDYQLSGGPGWMNSERYDISAASPEGNIDETRYELMLRALLADRFQLKLHQDTKQMPLYDLTPVKSGLKLPEGALSCVPREDGPPPAPVRGQPAAVVCGGFLMNGSHLEGRRISMTQFVNALANMLGRPVVDKTAYTGTFDVSLEFVPEGIATLTGGGFDAPRLPAEASSDSTGSTIFTVIQRQMGLLLQASRGAVEILVIDQAEKASEN